MPQRTGKWYTTNVIVEGRGLTSGVWLVAPDGTRVATFARNNAWAAAQCAAALNLTTQRQRTDYAAEQAGYGKSVRADAD